MIEASGSTIVDNRYCPAVSGGKVLLEKAGFKLCAEMDEVDMIGGFPVINVHGSFFMPGTQNEYSGACMQTIEIGIPYGSPAAEMVAVIVGDKTGFKESEVGRMLKTGAMACQCALAQCSRMDEMQLMFAIEAAASCESIM